jgi:hypothetical protein
MMTLGLLGGAGCLLFPPAQEFTLTGTNYIGQLYWAFGDVTDANDDLLSAISPVPGGNPVVRFRPSTTTAPGTWIGGNRTVGGVPGQLLTLQLRIWDIPFGNTYEEARQVQGQFGKSCVFSYTIPQSTKAPDLYYIDNFRGFSPLTICIPEPPTMVFGLAGAVGWLLFHRCKNSNPAGRL